MKHCAICGTDLGGCLFAAVTGDPVCAICKIKFIGGLPTSQQGIDNIRAVLGLADGQYLEQDNGAEARAILRGKA